jgi:serine/threonine-protein kinase
VAVFICQGCGAEHSEWGGKCPQCGTSETIRLAPATDRMVDRVVKGKFKIIRKLGQGGMGAVYLAEQLGIGHRVALKFLKSEFSSDAEIARRFLNEAKSYARVAHPNAVALHDFGQDEEGNLFIAMEYCEGVDLKKVIAEQGPLPMIEAIELVLQVADVLANAHEKGVIHRDLKPENIMIRRGIRGIHAKVLDFGIARLMDAGTKLTVAGAIAGTPRYMSPEQVEGKEVDARADIYSLGIVLYESLTGRQPFDGTTISEILRKQVTEPMPLLRDTAPDLDSPDLDAVLQRACAKPIAARWPDMLSFASALSQAIPTQAHLALPPLQRTNTNVRAVATPAPQAATLAGDPTGTDRTLLKESGSHSAVTAMPVNVGVIPLTHQVEAPTQLGAPEQPLKSKGPVYALGAVALVAVLGVGYAMTRPPPEEPQPPGPAVVDAPPPPKTVEAPPQVDVNVEALKLLKEQEKRVREENARMSLGKGKTEFEVAKLDEAETYLKSVDAETEAGAEAKGLLEKIGAIREKLKSANALRARGQCDQALPVYRSVLELNSKVSDAVAGAAACRQGTVAPTME